MRNPRPCEVCGEPELEHQCIAHPYRRKERREPLRAVREPKTTWLVGVDFGKGNESFVTLVKAVPAPFVSVTELRDYFDGEIERWEETGRMMLTEQYRYVCRTVIDELVRARQRFCKED